MEDLRRLLGQRYETYRATNPVPVEVPEAGRPPPPEDTHATRSPLVGPERSEQQGRGPTREGDYALARRSLEAEYGTEVTLEQYHELEGCPPTSDLAGVPEKYVFRVEDELGGLAWCLDMRWVAHLIRVAGEAYAFPLFRSDPSNYERFKRKWRAVDPATGVEWLGAGAGSRDITFVSAAPTLYVPDPAGGDDCQGVLSSWRDAQGLVNDAYVAAGPSNGVRFAVGEGQTPIVVDRDTYSNLTGLYSRAFEQGTEAYRVTYVDPGSGRRRRVIATQVSRAQDGTRTFKDAAGQTLSLGEGSIDSLTNVSGSASGMVVRLESAAAQLGNIDFGFVTTDESGDRSPYARPGTVELPYASLWRLGLTSAPHVDRICAPRSRNLLMSPALPPLLARLVLRAVSQDASAFLSISGREAVLERALGAHRIFTEGQIVLLPTSWFWDAMTQEERAETTATGLTRGELYSSSDTGAGLPFVVTGLFAYVRADVRSHVYIPRRVSVASVSNAEPVFETIPPSPAAPTYASEWLRTCYAGEPVPLGHAEPYQDEERVASEIEAFDRQRGYSGYLSDVFPLPLRSSTREMRNGITGDEPGVTERNHYLSLLVPLRARQARAPLSSASAREPGVHVFGPSGTPELVFRYSPTERAWYEVRYQDMEPKTDSEFVEYLESDPCRRFHASYAGMPRRVPPAPSSGAEGGAIAERRVDPQFAARITKATLLNNREDAIRCAAETLGVDQAAVRSTVEEYWEAFAAPNPDRPVPDGQRAALEQVAEQLADVSEDTADVIAAVASSDPRAPAEYTRGDVYRALAAYHGTLDNRVTSTDNNYNVILRAYVTTLPEPITPTVAAPSLRIRAPAKRPRTSETP